MERVPADDRPAHMAWHNVAFNLGILSGSLFGAGLGGSVGLRYGLLAAAALRFASGIALLLWA
jgi:predicted MFS family arabinose efflux permease